MTQQPYRPRQAAQQSGASHGTLEDAITGDVVVLALPYPALDEVLSGRSGDLAGMIVVDPTNPLDFATFDDLVVPAESSAAGQVGEQVTTVLIAGDDVDAKATLAGVVQGGGLVAVDAGSLKRARELEALGFLQLTMAAGETIGWTGGFSLVR